MTPKKPILTTQKITNKNKSRQKSALLFLHYFPALFIYSYKSFYKGEKMKSSSKTKKYGLSQEEAKESRIKYGDNTFGKQKSKSFLKSWRSYNKNSSRCARSKPFLGFQRRRHNRNYRHSNINFSCNFYIHSVRAWQRSGIQTS